MPLIMGAVWVADKAYSAYQVYQDVQSVRSGERTWQEVAQERGTELATGIALGGVGRVVTGIKAARHGANDAAAAARRADAPGPPDHGPATRSIFYPFSRRFRCAGD